MRHPKNKFANAMLHDAFLLLEIFITKTISSLFRVISFAFEVTGEGASKQYTIQTIFFFRTHFRAFPKCVFGTKLKTDFVSYFATSNRHECWATYNRILRKI